MIRLESIIRVVAVLAGVAVMFLLTPGVASACSVSYQAGGSPACGGDAAAAATVAVAAAVALGVVASLAMPGISRRSANSDLETLDQELRQAQPSGNAGATKPSVSLHKSYGPPPRKEKNPPKVRRSKPRLEKYGDVPRQIQTSPYTRFKLRRGVWLPSDARAWRQRDIPRIREADLVRRDIHARIQKAVDAAVEIFRATERSQRFTLLQEAKIRKREDAVWEATDACAAEEARLAIHEGGDAELKRLKEAKDAAWRRYWGTVNSESGTQIHKIFENIINQSQKEILGKHAKRYRLRAEAPYGIDGREKRPGEVRPDLVLERLGRGGQARYTAHAYDLKTGDKGINQVWEGLVDQDVRPLFQPGELRPSGPVIPPDMHPIRR